MPTNVLQLSHFEDMRAFYVTGYDYMHVRALNHAVFMHACTLD